MLHLSATAFINLGDVPQQPPAMRTPRRINSATSSENSSGSTSYTVRPFSILGRPAFGFTRTGTEAYLRYSSTMGKSCLGPREQFTPIASAPMPSSIATIDEGDAPVISLPSSPYAFETNTGREQLSFAAKRAAFVS